MRISLMARVGDAIDYNMQPTFAAPPLTPPEDEQDSQVPPEELELFTLGHPGIIASIRKQKP